MYRGPGKVSNVNKYWFPYSCLLVKCGELLEVLSLILKIKRMALSGAVCEGHVGRTPNPTTAILIYSIMVELRFSQWDIGK